MKALSIQQPRASQVMEGEKTMELRSWDTSYRGPLAIHAAARRRAARVRELGFVPESLVYGAILGTVQLSEVRRLDEAAYDAARPQHLSVAPFPVKPCYGWTLRQPNPLPSPMPCVGRRGLFDVDERLLDLPYVADPVSPVTGELGSDGKRDPLRFDRDQPFALFTLPDGEGYRVALCQWAQQPEGSNGQTSLAPGALWSIELGGDVLRAVSDQLLAALRACGHKATRLAREHRTPFYLDERTGVRLALVFLAVKPLARHQRIEAISHGVRAMSDEEAYYWFSKCSAGPQATRAQKALRVLLSEE